MNARINYDPKMVPLDINDLVSLKCAPQCETNEQNGHFELGFNFFFPFFLGLF